MPGGQGVLSLASERECVALDCKQNSASQAGVVVVRTTIADLNVQGGDTGGNEIANCEVVVTTTQSPVGFSTFTHLAFFATKKKKRKNLHNLEQIIQQRA